MKHYHVQPRDDGQWIVIGSASKRASSLHRTQTEAVAAARNLAHKYHGELIVHGRDGKIRPSFTAKKRTASAPRSVAPKTAENPPSIESRLGQRLQRARIMRGHSLRSLAEATDGLVSHTTLQKLEKGQMLPNTQVLGRLARILELRPDYFLQPEEMKLEAVEYRKFTRLGKKAQKQLEEEAFEFFERYLETEQLLAVDPNEIPHIPLEGLSGDALSEAIESATLEIRNRWNLGLNPIANVHSMLEQHDIKVALLDGRDGFDGFSAFARKGERTVPVIALSKRYLEDVPRFRFTALHELGHLVLSLPTEMEAREIERCCHRFASALLMPREAFIATFGKKRIRISVPELKAIKAEWGASFAAIMRRAHDLGLITDGRYKEYCIDASKRGWRGMAKEPAAWEGSERSNRFEQLVFRGLSDELLSISKACGLLGLSNDELAEKFDLVG